MFSSQIKKQIINLFDSIKENDEFEIMFNNYKKDNQLSLIKFMDVLKYIKYRSDKDKLKLSETISLDIYYNEYRVSINNINTINNILGLLYQRKNNNILSILLTQYIDKENFIFIQKIKNKSDIIDVDEYDIRFRKSTELKVIDENIINKLTKLTNIEGENILFRFKQRLTLHLNDNINIDLTIVKTSNSPNTIMNAIKVYELEIDYSSTKISKSILDTILYEVEQIKKVMEGSNIILNKDIKNNIIEKYIDMTFNKNRTMATNLYSMQPISTEVQHIIDSLPNKYTATDKADGEKYQLFIIENEVYLISNNLHIKKIDINIQNLNNSIVEGELIYLYDKQKYIFMMFDCLFFKNEDIRNKVLLKDRLKYLPLISKEFNINPYILNDYKNSFDINNIKKHYIEEIKNYYKELNKEINKIKKNDILIYPKLFLFPTGASSSEVFMYSELIWNNCTKDASTECPYILDGIIHTAIEQKYIREKKNIDILFININHLIQIL